MKRRWAWLVASWLGAVATLAGAQAIHRCGNTYTERPCPNGDEIEARDDRSAAQRKQALEAQRRHRQAADQLARDRRDFEAQPVAAGGIHGVKTEQADEAPPPKPRTGKHKSGKRKRRKAADAGTAGLRRSSSRTAP